MVYAEYDPKSYPAAALDAMKFGPEARIFTHDEWGDYLIYRLYPHTRVFTDGRSDFYGSQFVEKWLGVMQVKPDWEAILPARQGKIYGMFGIDIPKHLDKDSIRFNYERFIGHFSRVLHHVKMDYRKFPMAIYLFAETTEDRFGEFEAILRSDLSEFIDTAG